MKTVEDNLGSYQKKQNPHHKNQSNSIFALLLKPFSWLFSHLKLTLLLILIGAALYWWFNKEDASVQASPLLASVDRGDIENAVTAAGNLQPSSFVDVGAQVSGQLEKLHVDVGDVVTQGQLLAEIDASVHVNRVAASQASLKALEAQLSARDASLKLAQANADRQTRLIEQDATSQADFDSSINTLASAQSSLIQLQSQIAQSQASLASDEATLAFSTIAAPTDGTIISISLKEGQTLNATQQAPTILRIADLSSMTVQGEVSEADVSKLTVGMEVYFTTLGGGARRWYGKLRQILPKPVVSNNVVLYTALFDVENNDNALLSDMTAQIFFVSSSARNVIRVPVGALNFRDSSNLLNLNLDSDANIPDDAPQSANQGGRPQEFAGGGMGGGDDMGGGGMGGGMGDFTPEQIEEFRARGGGGMGGGGPQREISNDSEPTKATVIIALDDGEFERREITIGVTTRVSAEVLEGLSGGEQVIAGIVQERANSNGGPQQGGFGDGSGGGMGGGGGRF